MALPQCYLDFPFKNCARRAPHPRLPRRSRAADALLKGITQCAACREDCIQ